MALVLGNAQQLTSVEVVGNALSGKPFVARSGVYLGEIESAVLSTRFASKREQERGLQSVQCVHLGILAILEGDSSYVGQLWLDADIGVQSGMKDHLTDLCFLTGNVRQSTDQMGRQFVQAYLEDKVEALTKANARGETSMTTFPGLVGKKVLIAARRFGESSKTGQPRMYLSGFFALDGRSAVEQVTNAQAQNILDVRARLSGDEPLWVAPKREQQPSKPYGSGTPTTYTQAASSQAQSAYSQGVQAPQGYQAQQAAASSQAASAYGGFTQAASPYGQGQVQSTDNDGVPF